MTYKNYGVWKMQDWEMTDKLLANCEHNYGVWKMQDWKMTDKLAGTRVSVLSVQPLWPLCQMAVRCVVHLLTWLCVCIFDVYLAKYRKTLLELD